MASYEELNVFQLALDEEPIVFGFVVKASLVIGFRQSVYSHWLKTNVSSFFFINKASIFMSYRQNVDDNSHGLQAKCHELLTSVSSHWL